MTTDKTSPAIGPEHPPRWVAPSVSAAERDRGKLLGRAWRSLSLAINRLGGDLRPAANVVHARPASDLVSIEALVNGTPVEMLIARSDITSLAQQIEPDLARLHVRDAAIASLLDWITRIETTTPGEGEAGSGLTVSFLASRAAESNEADVFLTLGKDPFRIPVGLRNIAPALLQATLDSWPISVREYRFAKFAVAVSCGFANLSEDDLATLRIGDVIVVDSSPGDVTSRFLLAGGTTYLWTAGGGRITKINFDNEERFSMSDEFSDFDYEEDAESIEQPEDATTRVSFMAGVAQVRSLCRNPLRAFSAVWRGMSLPAHHAFKVVP